MITKYDWKIDAKNICFIGDIHGNYGAVLRENNRFTDTVFICCGDCGFGFNKPGYYKNTIAELDRRLEKKNNWCVMIRGNHDDPAYFRHQIIKNEKNPDADAWNPEDYSRVHMTDAGWEILKLINSTGQVINILCGGGAISIDRIMRVMDRNWWRDEEVDHEDPENIKSALDKYCSREDVYIASHTSPDKADPFGNKGVVTGFSMLDPSIEKECDEEREYMSKVFRSVVQSKANIIGWWYGHFHESYSGVMTDGDLQCRYIGLNIEELGMIENAWNH